MAEGERVHADRNVPGDVVVVGVAHAARDELDLHLVFAGILQFEVDDLEFAGDLPDDCAAGSHAFSLGSVDGMFWGQSESRVTTDFVSRYSASASAPFSRPQPDCL